LKREKEKEINKTKDSLRAAKEKIEEKLQKLDEKSQSSSNSGLNANIRDYNFIMYL
jgi:hypothetical protein